MSSPRQNLPPLTEDLIKMLDKQNSKPELLVYKLHLEQDRTDYAERMGKYDFVNSLVRRLKSEKERDHGQPS